MKIQSKVALVTGGAVRVGREITLALARAGADVVVNYHTSGEEALETCAEAEGFGVRALAVQADISDQQQVQQMVDKAVAELGGVDILVNSASLWRQTPFPMTDLTDWHRVTNILINGSFYCANQVAPLMLSAGEGAIVNIVDLSVFEPWLNYTAHCVGKSAVLALNRQLALELAPTVRVNAVAPGAVLPPPDFDQERIAQTAHRTLLNRWGSPADVAGAVLFFVQADYITGEVLRVDGGEQFGHRKRGTNE